MRQDANGRRLCEAHRKDGKPCRAPAVLGAKTCRMHGAAKGSPGRQAADRLTLAELVGPALVRLKWLLLSPDSPPAVQLGAAREILTRTGYGFNERPPERQIVEWLEAIIAEGQAGLSPDEIAAADARREVGQAAIAEYDARLRADARAAKRAARNTDG